MPSAMYIVQNLFSISPDFLPCHLRIFNEQRFERGYCGAGSSVLWQNIVELCHAENRMVEVVAVATYSYDLSLVSS